MESAEFELTDAEYEELGRHYPPSEGSAAKGGRAVEIVKLYFQKQNQDCRFELPRSGADLRVIFPDGSSKDVEVKGTGALGLAWNQLKVSGRDSFRLLVEGLQLYRVTNVYGRRPSIYVLVYGRDFTLVEEPRWAAKPVKGLPS